MKKEELEKLKKHIETIEVIFALSDDIHQHTRRLGLICHEFINADKQYLNSLKDAQNIGQVITDITASCPDEIKPNVLKVLESIRKSGGADSETKLPLQELLVRTWSLRNVYGNGVDLILSNLNHNISANGGCLPGIAARLVQPYTAFLFRALNNKYGSDIKCSLQTRDEDGGRASASMQSNNDLSTGSASASSIGADDEDKALQAAIDRSLQPSALLFTVYDENEALQAAIDLSLQQSSAEEICDDEDEALAYALHLSLN